MGIKVVRLNGAPVNFRWRWCAACQVSSAVVLLLGFSGAGWDRDEQAWHDKIGNTRGPCVLRMSLIKRRMKVAYEHLGRVELLVAIPDVLRTGASILLLPSPGQQAGSTG